MVMGVCLDRSTRPACQLVSPTPNPEPRTQPRSTEWILGNGPLELFAQSLLDADDPRINFAFLSSDEVRVRAPGRACVCVYIQYV